MKQEKIFLLGLGAQKSGTTWLFDYLNGNSHAKFGIFKEYHVLDTNFFPQYSVHN